MAVGDNLRSKDSLGGGDGTILKINFVQIFTFFYAFDFIVKHSF